MLGKAINAQTEQFYVIEVNGKVVCWQFLTTSLHITDFLYF
jgi:hypothetical protein